MTKTDKFKYVRSYLDGPSKTAIEGIRFGEDGYDAAVMVLNDRFRRKALFMADHVGALFAIPQVMTCADVEMMRRLEWVHGNHQVNPVSAKS